MKGKVLGEIRGVSVYSLSMETNNPHIKLEIDELLETFNELDLISLYKLEFRAVNVDRLSEILVNGIDVCPATSVIYTDAIDKAMEYGDWPKILMGLEIEKLSCTYKEVDSTISHEELNEIQKTYPTKVISANGKKIWLSRLENNSSNLATPYEAAYAKWIPGNPWECLKMIILVGLDDSHWDIDIN